MSAVACSREAKFCDVVSETPPTPSVVYLVQENTQGDGLLLRASSGDLQLRMKIADAADLLQERSDVENRRLGLPAADDLHIDRHTFFAGAEAHGDAWQAGSR